MRRLCLYSVRIKEVLHLYYTVLLLGVLYQVKIQVFLKRPPMQKSKETGARISKRTGPSVQFFMEINVPKVFVYGTVFFFI